MKGLFVVSSDDRHGLRQKLRRYTYVARGQTTHMWKALGWRGREGKARPNPRSRTAPLDRETAEPFGRHLNVVD